MSQTKRDNINAALGALALFTDAAATVHSNNLQVQENRLNREFQETQAQLGRDFSANQAELSRDHEITKMEIANENEKENSRIAFENQVKLQYPGVEFVNGVPDLTGYDYTKSTSFIESNVVAVRDQLLNNNISVDVDTDDDLFARKQLFDIGFNTASTATGAISSTISTVLGGDISPNAITLKDVDDIDQFIKSNILQNDAGETVLGPQGVSYLQELNVIPVNMEILSDANGLPYLSEKDTKELQLSLIGGMRQGAQLNANFMSNTDYMAWENGQRDKAIQYASQVAASPKVVQATNTYNAMVETFANTVGANIVDNKRVLNWAGGVIEMEEVVGNDGLLERYQDKNPTFIGKRYENVSSVLAYALSGGKSLEVIMSHMEGLNPDQRKLLIDDIKQIEGGNQQIGKSLENAYNMYSKISAVATATNQYYDEPTTLGGLAGVRGDLENLGIILDVQKLRTLEASGQENTDDYKLISSRYEDSLMKLIDTYKQTGNNERLKELQDWINIESATYNLNKQMGFK